VKQLHRGLFVTVGSIIVWFLANSILFTYITTVLYSNRAFGEPIWVIDLVGFLIVSVPLGTVFFIGIVMIFDAIIPRRELRADRSA